MSKKANNYIASIKARVQKKIDVLRNQAEEEYQNWADTGYQRYMNKKERLEAEADELEYFIKPELSIREAWAKADRLEAKNEELKLLLKSVSNVLDGMKYDFPDCSETRQLDHIVSKFKSEHMNQLN